MNDGNRMISQSQNNSTLVKSCKYFLLGILASPIGLLQSAPGPLSQLPLFLAKPVQPNIFFMLDDSGSMDWEVMRRNDGGGSGDLDFTPNDTTENLELCAGYNALAYDPSATYTPWFGEDRNGALFTDSIPSSARVNPYTAGSSTGSCDSSGDVNNDNGVTCDLINGFGGNGAFYYNWNDADADGLYDTGECPTDNASRVFVSTLSAQQQTNFANWFSYFRKREYVMKRAVSQVIEQSRQRIGIGTINRNNHITKGTEVGTQVKDIDDISLPIDATAATNKDTLLDNLLGVNSSSGTPLRLGLQNTGRYFMNQMSNSALFGYTPSAQADSAAGHSPILNETLGGTCQQNFAIVMSDGFWNGGDPSVGNTDIDGAGSDFDGQSYSDTVPNTLADVAMHYYETDLVALADEVPTVRIPVALNDQTECNNVISGEENLHPNCYDTNTEQHLVTFTVAFGVRGSIPETDGLGNPCLPPSRSTGVVADNWPALCNAALGAGWPTPAANTNRTVDDMMHAAWNGRGLFLSAKDPEQLILRLQQAIDDISSRNPVAATAVAVDTFNILSGGNVVQGKFDSSYWSGELYSYGITGGVVDTVPTWKAHDLLDSRAYNTRFAVTYSGSQGIPFEFPADYTDSSDFGSTEVSIEQVRDLLHDAPFPITTTDATEIIANQAYGVSLVNYLLGDHSSEGKNVGDFRYRGTHRLGDISHSSPVYVGDPDPSLFLSTSYQSWANNLTPTGAKGRRKMIYVGANDGGLHAFDAITGEEVFVYFPRAVFSDDSRNGLHWLADQAYEHRYYVDGESVVAEVYIDTGDGSGLRWRTILVGTLRGGGRSIFAIDISDPSEFNTEAGVASNILWEFTHDDLGYTYGKPTIAQLNNGRWAVILGNGYNPGPSSDGKAKLFIKYLDNATDVEILPDPAATSPIPGTIVGGDCLAISSDCNGLSSPAVVDLGADSVADRIYAGDVMGNLWVFDISSTLPASWGLAYGSNPLFQARSALNVAQPITSQPMVVLHPTERHSKTSPNTMVFIGTGQYIAENDPVNTGDNTFYGIWDSGSAITVGRGSALIEQTVNADTLSGFDVRLLTNNPVDYTTNRGWYFDLPDSGERVIVNPIVFGDLVVYTTMAPESNLCSSSAGYSWLMVHNLIDGTEPDFVSIDVNNDGDFDSDDQVGDENVAGIRSGSLYWQPTLVKSGVGAIGTLLVPAEDLDTYTLQGNRGVGTRSSWGRFWSD